MNSRRVTSWSLLVLFALTLGLRMALPLVPSIENLFPRPYRRVMNFDEAAVNIQEGRGAVLDRAHVLRVAKAWRQSGRRLPPSATEIPRLGPGDPIEYYDEKGYLMLRLALGRVTGESGHGPVLWLQGLLSASCALLLFFSVRGASGSAALGWLVGLGYGLNPLEIMQATGPDLPVWSTYAAAAGVALALWPWRMGGAPAWIAAAGLGAFSAFCVIQRAPTLAVFVASVGSLLWLHRRRAIALAASALAGSLVVFGVSSVASQDAPTVGRNAMYHSLLAGLSEFGHIEGLAWDDSRIHAYMADRYGVEPLTPAFNQAARVEFLRVLGDRPWLPLQVTARRFVEFAVLWRPTRNALPLLLVFTLFKITVLVGLWRLVRRAGDATHRRAIQAYCMVAIAPVAVHMAIVPLLEAYIASFFVLTVPLAVWGGTWIGVETLNRIGIAQWLRPEIASRL